MCLGMVLFGSNLFETLCASWTLCLFLLPNQGSFFSLFFQVSFWFLALLPLCLASLWFGGWYIWRCPRGFLYYPCFFLNSCFFLLFWLNEFFINLINYLHFIRIFFFWFVFLVSSFETYSSVFSLCLIFCVCFCELDKTNTSPDPEGVALRMSNLPVDRDCWVVLAGCWSLRG